MFSNGGGDNSKLTAVVNAPPIYRLGSDIDMELGKAPCAAFIHMAG